MQTKNEKFVTINLFLWVSSSVQIWNPPSRLSFFSFFAAVFFVGLGSSVSLLGDSFSGFSPFSTLKTKHTSKTLDLCTFQLSWKHRSWWSNLLYLEKTCINLHSCESKFNGKQSNYLKCACVFFQITHFKSNHYNCLTVFTLDPIRDGPATDNTHSLQILSL